MTSQRADLQARPQAAAVLRLDVQYDGAAFHGWQAMPATRTVQGALQEAARTLLRAPVVVHAAGRTDAGVHASGQVCTVDLSAVPGPQELRRWHAGFNALLRPHVVVTRLTLEPPGFHARFSAIGKRYVYRVHNAPHPPLFDRFHLWHVPAVLDALAMQQACWCLLGEHDFDAFRAAGCQAAHAHRYLWRARVQQHGNTLSIEFRGNAFVRNQVRIMAGTLVDIGRGAMAPEQMRMALESRNRGAAGRTAPPHGLTLAQVYYPADAAEADIPADARWPGWPA